MATHFRICTRCLCSQPAPAAGGGHKIGTYIGCSFEGWRCQKTSKHNFHAKFPAASAAGGGHKIGTYIGCYVGGWRCQKMSKHNFHANVPGISNFPMQTFPAFQNLPGKSGSQNPQKPEQIHGIFFIICCAIWDMLPGARLAAFWGILASTEKGSKMVKNDFLQK